MSCDRATITLFLERFYMLSTLIPSNRFTYFMLEYCDSVKEAFVDDL